MKKKLVTCLVSGGMDSLTCVAIMNSQNYEIQMLHINYGQLTEKRELKAFLDIGDFYNVLDDKRLIVSIKHLTQIGGSSLTDPNIDVTDADLDSAEVPSSYVPFRNAHILSVAVSWSEVTGAELIVIGAVAEDSSGYPDCRPEFYDAFNKTIDVGTKSTTHIEIVTPIINMSKAEIIRTANSLEAPLASSWSCYKNDGYYACGICDSCALRLKGFREAGLYDPISYVDNRDRYRY